MSDDLTIEQGGEGLRRARELSRHGQRPPVELPGYELIRFLGAGAYGEVWVAIDVNTRRHVAIKFYEHRGGLDWSLLSREVEKLGFLFADRYVVQLLDVGWDSEPPYYVMEYLEHGSLEDRLQAGPLPVDQAVSIFREVAVGLMHAHGKGVLHCDLKPANILLDQDAKPRLADFGQSRLSHEQLPSLGTLFYMAPEQADLEASPDARWDVYALGAVLYRALVGDAPFRDDVAAAAIEQSASLDGRLEKYRDALKSASRPVAHRQVPGVDRMLAEIIDKCLAVNPQRRYRNVQAVLDALEARSSARARRPLLVLGAIGPAILLLVVSLFAISGFDTAVRQSGTALVSRAQESNYLAADFVAKEVAGKIEARWRILVEAASDPRIQTLLQQARHGPLDDAQTRELSALLWDMRAEHADVRSTSWFVNDAIGTQLARAPFVRATVGDHYGFRDYFHGGGRDFDPHAPDYKVPPPIRAPHRSIVFKSTATLNRMVAFSVPVWDATGEGDERDVIGVLAMTVELGDFAELRPESGAGHFQLAAMVDLRPDALDHAGAVVEHPQLASMAAGGDEKKDAVYVDDDTLARFRQLTQAQIDLRIRGREITRAAFTKAQSDKGQPVTIDEEAQARQVIANDPRIKELKTTIAKLGSSSGYRDPTDTTDDNTWVAAYAPVLVGQGVDGTHDSGWVVVIQERRESVTEPASDLGQRLVRQGLVALGVVVVVITGLWAFVARLLNPAPRRGFFGRLRRRMGLAGDTLGSGGGSASVGDSGGYGQSGAGGIDPTI